MTSEKWKNCVGAVRTYLRTVDNGYAHHAKELKTERQWAELGFLPMSEEAGKSLWTNQFCGSKARYLFPDEVRQGTAEELREYFAPMRERRKKLRAIRKAEAKQQTEREAAQLNARLVAEEWKEKSRLAAANPAEEMPVLSDVVVLDCETTGLDFEKLEPLEISIISGEGAVLYQSYLKPLYTERWPEAEAINHISPQMVRDAPTIMDEGWKIRAILEHAKQIIIYNADFDLAVMAIWTGFRVSDEQWVRDTMLDFAAEYGEWDEYHGDYRWKKLAFAAHHYGYEWEGDAHDSLADCKATLFVHNKLHEKEQSLSDRLAAGRDAANAHNRELKTTKTKEINVNAKEIE